MSEVEARLGRPTSIIEETLWIYQYGKDPDAALTFQDQKVVEVLAPKYK